MISLQLCAMWAMSNRDFDEFEANTARIRSLQSWAVEAEDADVQRVCERALAGDVEMTAQALELWPVWGELRFATPRE